MGLDFNYNENASIEHLNIRKEGNDNDILAIDVKVSGQVQGNLISQLFGCSHALAIRFWDNKSEEIRPIYNGIAAIVATAEFDHCKVAIGTEAFTGCKVRKFRVVPMVHGEIRLTCMISLSDVDENGASYLCSIIRDQVKIEVTNGRDMLAEAGI